MARPNAAPSFPDTPGAWPAHYRYRMRAPGEAHLSRRTLGASLGVSSWTVRRWENGSAAPQTDELQRLAGACDLTRLESDFLQAAFQARGTEQPPADEAFREWACTALAVDYPCVVFDSLYFVRAWNEQFVAMFPTARFMTGAAWHGVPLYERIHAQGSPFISLQILVRCLREVWWRTAPYCGAPVYRRLLALWRQIPDLESRWLEFGQIPDHHPVGMPYAVGDSHCGTYMVSSMPVSLPPTYYLRGYVPCDEAAHDATTGVGSREVYFAPAVHWAAEAAALQQPDAAPRRRAS